MTEQSLTRRTAEQPLVDAVIAVHSPTRPIERAVGSILDHTRADVRVTVVIHNTDPEPILARLRPYADDPRLRTDVFADGIPSPAGPMNRGFDLATAAYTTLLGSDDAFEPGAIDAWLAAARLPGGRRADAVIAPVRDEAGRLHPSPPVRSTRIGARRNGRSSRRSAELDGARDRLAYRAAALGLIGRDRFGGLRFAEGVETGEDQPFSAELWFAPGSRIVFPVRAPGYRVHADQHDRVTHGARSVDTEFRVLEALLDPGASWSRDPAARLSLAVKLIRMQLFDAVRNRLEGWDPQTAEQLARVARRVLKWEPRAPRLLARVDERLLRAILAADTDTARLGELLEARTRLRSPAALLPRRPGYALHPQAPLRFHLAGALLLRLGSR